MLQFFNKTAQDSSRKTKRGLAGASNRCLKVTEVSAGTPCEQVYRCPVSHVNEIISARLLDASVSAGLGEGTLNRLFCSPVTLETALMI